MLPIKSFAITTVVALNLFAYLFPTIAIAIVVAFSKAIAKDDKELSQLLKKLITKIKKR